MIYSFLVNLMSSISDLFDDSFDDHAYAQELQLQEVLDASSAHATSTSHDDASTSNSQRTSCQICTEEKENSGMFRIAGCSSHDPFCSLCISKHVEYKLIHENIVSISCPNQDCNNPIEPYSLGSIISPHLRDRWEEAIIESTIIMGCKKVRCPYEGCLEVMVSDYEGSTLLTNVVVKECECPSCHRLFCANCEVPWHHGFDCDEFERANKSSKNTKEEKLNVLARQNNWKRCPNCEVFVEKVDGCIHITCRCKFVMCYACGSEWNESHWNSCQ